MVGIVRSRYQVGALPVVEVDYYNTIVINLKSV